MSNDQEIEILKEKVATGNRLLYHEKLADIYGHVSARIPNSNKLLIKPFIKPLKDIMPEDIITVDMDDYQLSVDMTKKELDKKPAPPSETILHIAVYQNRRDVMGVVHSHQPLATCFGIAGKQILPLHNQFCAFSPATPIYEKSDLICTPELADDAAKALGNHNALLLRGHGVVVVVTFLGNSAEVSAWYVTIVLSPRRPDKRSLVAMVTTLCSHQNLYFAFL